MDVKKLPTTSRVMAGTLTWNDHLQDHHSALNVSVDATVQQIKSAARKPQLRHHTDQGGRAETEDF
jgi:hypothetical protein